MAKCKCKVPNIETINVGDKDHNKFMAYCTNCNKPIKGDK